MNSGNISTSEQKKEFDNLKSDFIFKKIIMFMKRNKSLSIMKYNKKLQKRLNININDYKECSKIEIELKLVAGEYGKFINIPDEDKEYYHIYFDNSNNEVTKCYLEENDEVKMIKIIIDYQVKSLEELFDNCNYIESISFKKFYRNNITYMNYMFSCCSSLKELNLSNFNTKNVTDMNGMFYECSSLKEINLSNFNTDNVTDMSSMFYGCSSLKELNLSNFNTNKVTDMSSMFYGCSLLKELNLSNFNTNKVTDMENMFTGCSDELRNKIKEQNKKIFI